MIVMRDLGEIGATVIEPGPQLKLDNAQDFLKAVRTIPAVISPCVIVNMEKTSFVDSSGIGALVNALKHVRGLNGQFVLAGLRPEILRSFHLMNLHQVFDIYESEELARQQLKERTP
jgi:anti-anti-sigma factor